MGLSAHAVHDHAQDLKAFLADLLHANQLNIQECILPSCSASHMESFALISRDHQLKSLVKYLMILYEMGHF